MMDDIEFLDAAALAYAHQIRPNETGTDHDAPFFYAKRLLNQREQYHDYIRRNKELDDELANSPDEDHPPIDWSDCQPDDDDEDETDGEPFIFEQVGDVVEVAINDSGTVYTDFTPLAFERLRDAIIKTTDVHPTDAVSQQREEEIRQEERMKLHLEYLRQFQTRINEKHGEKLRDVVGDFRVVVARLFLDSLSNDKATRTAWEAVQTWTVDNVSIPEMVEKK